SGHQVLILDNLSTGSIENISHLKSRKGFEYFIDTVENEPLLAELIDRSDVVFHFAAAVGVKLIVEQPVYTIETNVHGTEVVLKHANKKKKLVVIASTSEVYGKSNDVPFREDSDLVLGPTPKHRWAYACRQVINIGNTQEVTIADLAKRVRDLTGSQSVIKFIPYDEAYESGFEDMPRRLPDLTKVSQLIGYSTKRDLDDILNHVIEYFRKK